MISSPTTSAAFSQQEQRTPPVGNRWPSCYRLHECIDGLRPLAYDCTECWWFVPSCLRMHECIDGLFPLAWERTDDLMVWTLLLKIARMYWWFAPSCLWLHECVDGLFPLAWECTDDLMVCSLSLEIARNFDGLFPLAWNCTSVMMLCALLLEIARIYWLFVPSCLRLHECIDGFYPFA